MSTLRDRRAIQITDRAAAAAKARGMVLTPSPDHPDRCRVRCNDCGWGGTWGFDVVTSNYLREPHGCDPCRNGE